MYNWGEGGRVKASDLALPEVDDSRTSPGPLTPNQVGALCRTLTWLSQGHCQPQNHWIRSNFSAQCINIFVNQQVSVSC